ncbi:MAG TPA: NAD(P)/FAD-dependent oxidoreductase [Solirubrobacteraceae bacterium]
MSENYDVIVVGAGPAGEVAAGRLADAGVKVAIVEQHLVGGECSFYACMPSKGLLRPDELLGEAKRVPGVREAVTGGLDVQVVLDRRDEIIHDADDSAQLPWLEDRGIALVRGHGVLTGEREVTVGDEVLTAAQAVIIGTGTKAAIPPIDGLREAEPWTNREATTAKHVPKSLLVLGGGVSGVELAQAFASLGAQVTLVEANDRLISREEGFACHDVLEALRGDGVDVQLGCRPAAVARDGDGVTVKLEDGREFRAEEVLCALGRQVLTEDLGLETVGLEPGKPIEVDDRMRVPGHDWLYVVGDANGRAPLTHVGKYQARVAADDILGRGRTVNPLADGLHVPRVIFTNPQVAAVGHTEASAAAAGVRVRCVEAPTSATAGASFVGKDTAGTCKLVIDEQRDVIIGATFTGFEVAEWLHAATIAIVGEVPLKTLYHATPSFPTRSETWLKLLEAAEG